MKVALIDPSLFTWPYDSALASGLTKNGHDVVIFGKSLPAKDRRAADPGFHGLFYKGLSAPALARLPKPLFYGLKGMSHIASMAHLWSVLWRTRPDIIHFQWLPLPAVDNAFLPAFARIAPVILTVHDTRPFNDNPGSALQKLGAMRVLRRFDRLIVHTDQGRERLREHVDDAARIARVDHGLLHESGPAGDIDNPTPRRADDPITFLLFGKLKPYKGIDVLIRALAWIQPDLRARCRIRIVGQPYMDVSALQNLAETCGVGSMIEFDLRFVPDAEMESMIAQSSALVFPYREIEASGVLMAALAKGKPIIASRLGAFAETISSGTHGLLVPPEDERALAQALSRLLEYPALLERMTASVRNLRDAIPSWPAIARTTTEVYETALSDRRRLALA
jgi:glycosyltransferase involved in cell wall biosynthesis